MTRIIAGTHRGRNLVVPPSGTRPTSDRAREGLFSSLASLLDLEGASVLDLYAGSGAVGLEALSRGARSATLVESNAKAAQTIRDNARKLELKGARIEQMTVGSFLAAAPRRAQETVATEYDLIFLDPPYDLSIDADLLALDLGAFVGEDTIVCVERASRRSGVEWPHGWGGLKERRYGEATLWYGRRL